MPRATARLPRVRGRVRIRPPPPCATGRPSAASPSRSASTAGTACTAVALLGPLGQFGAHGQGVDGREQMQGGVQRAGQQHPVVRAEPGQFCQRREGSGPGVGGPQHRSGPTGGAGRDRDQEGAGRHRIQGRRPARPDRPAAPVSAAPRRRRPSPGPWESVARRRSAGVRLAAQEGSGALLLHQFCELADRTRSRPQAERRPVVLGSEAQFRWWTAGGWTAGGRTAAAEGRSARRVGQDDTFAVGGEAAAVLAIRPG